MKVWAGITGAIAAQRGLEVVRSFPQIRFAFLRPQGPVHPVDLGDALQADPRVEHAYPEVVEHVGVPY